MSPRRVEASAQIDIAATPDVVWRWVTEPDRVVRWVQDLVESRALDDGAEPRVGARSVAITKINGTPTDVPTEVTAVDPGRLIETRLGLSGGPALSRVLLEPSALGTRVTQAMESPFTDLWFVPSAVIAGVLEQRLRGDLRRLKQLAEEAQD